jgi:hypothetical protein
MGATESLPSTSKWRRDVFIKIHNRDPSNVPVQQKAKLCFSSSDTDKGAAISLDEFRKAATELRLCNAGGEAKVDAAFRYFDADSNGNISLVEFISFVTCTQAVTPTAPAGTAPTKTSPRKAVQARTTSNPDKCPDYWNPDVKKALKAANAALNGMEVGDLKELSSIVATPLAVLQVCAAVAYLNPQKAGTQSVKMLMSFAMDGSDDGLWKYCKAMLNDKSLLQSCKDYDKGHVSSKFMGKRVKKAKQMVKKVKKMVDKRREEDFQKVFTSRRILGSQEDEDAVGIHNIPIQEECNIEKYSMACISTAAAGLLVWVEAVLACVLYDQ